LIDAIFSICVLAASYAVVLIGMLAIVVAALSLLDYAMAKALRVMKATNLFVQFLLDRKHKKKEAGNR
jgi:hypothetical protein